MDFENNKRLYNEAINKINYVFGEYKQLYTLLERGKHVENVLDTDFTEAERGLIQAKIDEHYDKLKSFVVWVNNNL